MKRILISACIAGEPVRYKIYDGTFSGNLIPGRGVTAARFLANNIPLFNENEIKGAARFLAG